MKSIILFLVSMFILLSCGISDNFTEPPCNEFYYGTVQVKFENGKPCTTAWAQLQVLVNQFHQVTADTGGWLQFKADFGCSEDNLDIELCPCTIYIERPESLDDSSKVIWRGDVEMIRSSSNISPWPDPLEIIIPDSLAP
jgi:hypothetical protein